MAQTASVGDALNWAFKKFAPHASVLVVFALVPALVSLVLSFTDAGVNDAVTTGTEQFDEISFGGLFGGLIIAIAGFALTLLALMGLINAALKITRGEQPTLGDFWHPGRAVNYILVSILAGLGIGFGFVLCLIPGLILWWAWQFSQYSALGTDLGVTGSLKESWNLVMANKGPALLALLVGVLASILTSFGWFGALLSLVVTPIMVLFMANLYRQFRGEAIAA